MCNSPLIKSNYSSVAERLAKDSVKTRGIGQASLEEDLSRHSETSKKPEQQDTQKEPLSAQVTVVKSEKELKKSVKWAGELVETLLYHPLQRCEEMATDNTLIIKDLPNIVLNGSLSRNAPRWMLGSLLNATSNMSTETGIRLVESSVVCHSQLFGLVQIPNLAFEKQVSLIYTTNDWKQVLTLPLVYHSSSADGKTDLFQFHIDLQSLSPLSVVLRFCFKYTYGGVGPDAVTIYENNFQRNFSMALSVSLPPHKDANKNYVSPIKKRSKPRIPQSSRRMVSLTLQDSCSSFLLVPPPKSMMSTYSLSYSYS